MKHLNSDFGRQPTIETLPAGFSMVERRTYSQRLQRGFSTKNQPFELENYPNGPYYLPTEAARVICGVVGGSTINDWAKKNVTSFGFVMGAEMFNRHIIIPKATVDKLKELLPDRAALDMLVKQYYEGKKRSPSRSH